MDVFFGGAKLVSTSSSTLYFKPLSHNFSANAPSGVLEIVDKGGYVASVFFCRAAKVAKITSKSMTQIPSRASRERFFIPASPSVHPHASRRIDASHRQPLQTSR